MKSIINNWRLFKYALRFTPLFVLLTVIDNIFLGFLNSYVTVIFLKSLFDQIETGTEFSKLMYLTAFLLLFFVVGYIFHVIYMHFCEPLYKYKLHSAIRKILFEKLSKIEVEYYDNPSYYNDFVWIMNEADGQVFSLVKDIGTLINRIISVSTIVVLLATVDWTIAACILVSVIVSLLLKRLQTKIQYESEQEMLVFNRKTDYLNNLYLSKDYAKEIHATDVSSIIDRELNNVILTEKDILKKNGKKKFYINFSLNFFTANFFNIGIFLLLLYKIQVSKSISLGDFAASAGSSWKLFWQINSFADVLSRFQKRDLYSQRFQKLMARKNVLYERASQRTIPQGNIEITFCNVSFRYPGSEEWILRDINFQIRNNEKIAIVGYNGAGKTTLIRLIMRLYEPTEGVILLNGFDVREYNIEEYRSLFSTIFQNFKLYAFSVAENVMMRNYIERSEDEKVWTALKNAGISDKINEYSKGIHTIMTKEFDEDGVELSGGQLQKLAIARAFAQDAQLIIMDEPTSALDPISEYEIYKKMLELSNNRTCIIISHRLSIARDVDWILYLENGRIAEKGPHERLLNENGKYAEMWNIQTKNLSSAANVSK